MTIGILFKNIRIDLGLSQVEMSSKLGITQGTLSRIESGSLHPTGEAVVALMRLVESRAAYAASRARVAAFLKLKP